MACPCGQPGTMKCGQCKVARYCSKPCQQHGWPEHKPQCIRIVECTRIKDHLIGHWKSFFDHLFEYFDQNANTGFTFYALTYTHDMPCYYTLALCTDAGQPDNLYFDWSDHSQGIFAQNNFRGYTCSELNCVRGVHVGPPIVVKTPPPQGEVSADINVAYIGWNSGLFHGFEQISKFRQFKQILLQDE